MARFLTTETQIIARPFRFVTWCSALVILAACISCGPDASTGPAPTTTTSEDSVSEPADTTTDEGSADPTANTADQSAAGDDTPEADVDPNRVLRHAVFFSFKETTSDEKLQEIVDAFRALPSKIEEIIDFQWGTNNSPEKLDDGFTHCFLLTFKDEAGRAVYLPHPDHKAFGAVLGGQNDKVFVIDYWGTASEPIENELKHAVFFKFKDDAAPEDIRKVEQGFAELPSKIDAIKGFEWGVNNSPERHSHGFTHCFMVSFDSDEGRAAYLPHSDHEAFVEVLEPHIDKVRVLDFNAQK